MYKIRTVIEGNVSFYPFFAHFFSFSGIFIFSRGENYFAKLTNSQFANCSSLYLNYKFAFKDLFTFSLIFRDDKNVEFKFTGCEHRKNKMEVRRKSSEEGVSPTSNKADSDSNMADPKFSTQKVIFIQILCFVEINTLRRL